jgi:excisionase family DNA binding protein
MPGNLLESHMAKSKTKRSRSADSQNIVEFVVDGRVGQMLSRRARRYAQRYPNRAAAAAAAAIEGAAAAHTSPDPAPPGVADRDSLAEFIIDVPWEEAGLVNASEAAAMLGVNRKTVYDWIDKGRLLGWQTSRQRYAIPREQIVGAERIVEGIPQ